MGESLNLEEGLVIYLFLIKISVFYRKLDILYLKNRLDLQKHGYIGQYNLLRLYSEFKYNFNIQFKYYLI